jgi:hypothetical protein
VDPGYRTAGLLTLRVSLPKARYAEREALAVFHDQLAARLAAVPGVQEAAAASVAPLTPWRATINFTVDGQPAPAPENVPLANYRAVDERYFAAMGIPVLRGRVFTQADGSAAAPIALINRTLAERYWPGGDPVGGRLTIDDEPKRRTVEVVGVVGDVKHYALDDAPSLDVYVPYVQAPQSVAVWLANSTSWVLRTSVEPGTLAPAVRREVQAVDPEVAATLLAAGGIYAVTAYLAAQRTRELGIRLALGARRAQIVSLVLAQGMAPVAGGLFLGLGGALAFARVLDGLLFGVPARDPATFVLAPLLLAATAVAANGLPAARAARMDPAKALRIE